VVPDVSQAVPSPILESEPVQISALFLPKYEERQERIYHTSQCKLTLGTLKLSRCTGTKAKQGGSCSANKEARSSLGSTWTMCRRVPSLNYMRSTNAFETDEFKFLGAHRRCQ
jgi:hypothetical protein